MSQFRFVRISLMLAAIGLNAAPALMTGAHAQKPPPATSGTAEVKPTDTVRPELYKLLDPAAIKVLMTAKKYTEVQEKITAAEAFPNRTPYENYIIDRMKVALGSGSGNEAMTMAALEAVINSGRMAPAEKGEFILALGNYYYNNKNYGKAIEWMKLYQKDSPTPNKVRGAISRAYYLSNDFAAAKNELVGLIADTEKEGKQPTMEDLRLLAGSSGKLKDMVTYVATLEKLVALYPADDFWTDLLNRMQSKPTFANRLQLDVYRLERVALKAMAPEEYTEMAELALVGGFPTEAKKAIDAGFANNVLGNGTNAAKHKQLRERAAKGAADDAKNISSGEAGAAKSKDGTGLVNLGWAYVTMDQFDKGIDFIKQGIAKGGLKRVDDANLKLAMAHAMAGHKADALKLFEGLKGNDGMSDLSKYWTLWLNQPVAAAPAAPAASAPK